MAKKEEKITFKSILNKLVEKSLNSLISIVAQESEHITKWLRDLSGLGKKIRRLLTTLILFTAGLGILGIGTAIYISELSPKLSSGQSHILVGLFVILIAAIYSKSTEWSIIKNTNLSANIKLLFFIMTLVIFYLMLKPLLNVFLASILFAYIFYPVYKIVRKNLKYENISILVTIILIIVIFLLPFIFVASQIPKQATGAYNYVKVNIIDKDYFNLECNEDDSLKCKATNFITGSGYFNFNKIVEFLFNQITTIAKNIAVSIPKIIIGVALALFISFFLFKDGKNILKNFVNIIPLNKKYSSKLIDKFGKVAYSVVFAHIIVAIAQGALGTIGFYIFGIESAIFWGVVMSIFALLPLIGPAIIWLPSSLFLLVNGILLNSFGDIGKGIGLFLYGLFIISMSDNILRIKLVGGKGDVHPLTVLVGLIGGINLFGLIGIFVGPIILSLLITFLKDFSKNYA